MQTRPAVTTPLGSWLFVALFGCTGKHPTVAGKFAFVGQQPKQQVSSGAASLVFPPDTLRLLTCR